MTAQKAKKIADSHGLDGLNVIVKAIDIKANNGEYVLFWYETIKPIIITKLELSGFNVKSLPTMRSDDPSYQISWH